METSQHLRQITHKKIKISQNKKPIPMELFLSFLTVDVVRSKKHLGSTNGWTLLMGEDNLQIGGGIVDRVEYLDCLKYKNKLDNKYNDFVNPFYLFDILSEEGKKFFLDYYADDIKAVLDKAEKESELAQRKAIAAKEKKQQMSAFWGEMRKQYE
jgi:hypothetical protein